MWSTCCWDFNDMGVARVNEIALASACFTLQALTFKFNEELGFRSSNGVPKKDISILSYQEHDTHLISPTMMPKMLVLKLARVLGGDPIEQLLGQVTTMER